MPSLKNLLKNQEATTTIEVVALMPVFLLLTFFIFEILIAVFLIGTTEKAVQAGARLAVVSDYAAAGLANTVNPLIDRNHAFGQACSAGACTSFTQRVCTSNGTTCSCTGGGACTAAAFNRIVSRMHDISYLVSSQYDTHTTITYTYVSLGFAGGPIVPNLTVTVQGIPYNTVATSLLSRFFTLINHTSTASPLTTLPAISASFTSEDVNSTNPS